MSVALVIALVVVVAAFIVERRLNARDIAAERLRWETERSSLLNRIKPETSQPPPMVMAESFNVPAFDGPNSDSEFWEDQEN